MFDTTIPEVRTAMLDFDTAKGCRLLTAATYPHTRRAFSEGLSEAYWLTVGPILAVLGDD